jgi:hypothetical protein
MKKIAILQSNYIPWKGYFDMIRSVDEFILYDDMQYTRRDWRNRNLVKSPQGLHWLTIPVEVKGKYDQKIKDTKVSNNSWAKDHWKTIKLFYSKTPHFKKYERVFEKTYQECESLELLSQVNFKWISLICGLLQISAKLSWSMDYELKEGKTERLIGLCQSAGATHYLSGPAAKDYIVPELFHQAKIELSYMDYAGYAEYHQLYGPFEHSVSVIDLIFNEGSNAVNFLKSNGISFGKTESPL